jgi:hypothetical protein
VVVPSFIAPTPHPVSAGDIKPSVFFFHAVETTTIAIALMIAGEKRCSQFWLEFCAYLQNQFHD